MMPSGIVWKVRFQYTLPSAPTSNTPPPPWEAERCPRIYLLSPLPASLVDLRCRVLDVWNVYTVVEGPEGVALQCFSPEYYLLQFHYVWTTHLK